MADVEPPPVEAVTEALPADLNDTEPIINGTTGKIPATPEGLALAYSSLVIMALLPIFFGAFRSVKSQKEVQENSATTGERPEIMSQKDAAMFPIIASCALFGLYLFFQFFSKEHINLLLSVYFFVLKGLCYVSTYHYVHCSRKFKSTYIFFKLFLDHDVC